MSTRNARLVRGVAGVLAPVVAAIAFTAWALESSGVAVITTRSAAGERAWIALLFDTERSTAVWLRPALP